jgi:hypothetical protein
MNNTLKLELIEVFTGQVERHVRAAFAALTASFGPSLSDVANSRQYRLWAETVRPCCDRSGNRAGASYSLNEQRVASFAASLANDLATEVLAKVDAKVGELENSCVRRVGGANFVISGVKSGRNVTIEQNQIINCSVKGRLFNQYPSRIYVDGKFTSAAKFATI